MSAVSPEPRPGDPLRIVASRRHTTNYTLDRLECGHEIADYDNRRPLRRRCRACGEWLDRMSGHGYGSGARIRTPREGEE